MQLQIHTERFGLTDSLRTYIERGSKFSFGWCRDALIKVHFRLSDINGPRGGADKSCQIRLCLNAKQEVIIEDVQSDLYVAIDRALERASRSLARMMARRRQFEHARFNSSQPLAIESQQ